MQIFLETDRLRLRRFTEADAGHLFELDNDPDVMRFINGGKPADSAQIQSEVLPRFLRGGFWAAVEKATGNFLGWFEFRPLDEGRPGEVELGYRLRKAAWGKGYATEGALALIRKGFTELGVQRVVAFTMTVNASSRRVMEKAGLKYVRTFHQQWPDYIDGAEHGDVQYAITRSEWGDCQQ